MTNKEKLDSIIGKLFDQVNDSANKKEAINADTLTALERLIGLTASSMSPTPPKPQPTRSPDTYRGSRYARTTGSVHIGPPDES